MVGVDSLDSPVSTGWSAEDSIDELARLVGTIGINVVGSVIQKLPVPKSRTFVGQGKVEEITALYDKLVFDLLVFDDELSLLQYKTLSSLFPDITIVDRVAIILEIFSRHANTKEGRLQVELARAQYLLPRLTGHWRHLERLGGGIGTRGPGESQLETDKRLVQKRITAVSRDIDKIRKHRSLYRRRRLESEIPIVALVGYTNSGKSSLLKALTKTEILVQDQLFATLDPTTRRMCLPNMQKVLLTDTVGFIHKLPPTIVEAFKSTLEELQDASLLLHVVDISSPNATEQCRTVENILRDLNIDQKPVITVYNKIDLLDSTNSISTEPVTEAQGLINSCPKNTVMISAVKRIGFDRLIQNIEAMITK